MVVFWKIHISQRSSFLLTLFQRTGSILNYFEINIRAQ